MTMQNTTKPRARDLGLPFTGRTGPLNAITDVPEVAVGLHALREAQPRPGRKLPVRTGVTAIIPHPRADVPVPVFAGIHRFNGNGEMTGTHWIEDGGYFLGPVTITNTHSVGIAHHATVKWMLERYSSTYYGERPRWIMPVVAETFDGILNDINALALSEADVRAALNSASGGPVAEGNSGGGTAMIAYGFKGGTGTSSRQVRIADKDHTVGVLVQANHGLREWLTVCGVPVGRHLPGAAAAPAAELGSIIVVVATDIAMAPHQLKRVARRCGIGIGRNGTPGGNSSGDIFLAFSTANPRPLAARAPAFRSIDMLEDDEFDPVYMAVVEAVEEAVINAMLAAEGMSGTVDGRDGIEAIPVEALVEIMRRHGRDSAR
ncbi:MAG: P1 family peptidase [Mesorhizobium sp.]